MPDSRHDARAATARSDTSGLPPPHDDEAEAAVLAAMMLPADAVERAQDAGLRPEHFHSPARQAIAAAIFTEHAESGHVDPVVVTDRLRAAGSLDIAGGELAVVGLSLTSPPPTISLTNRYAGIVRSKARQRELIRHAAALQMKAYTHGDPSAEVNAINSVWEEAPDDLLDGSWRAVDMAEVLTGTVTQPIPELLTRDDGQALFYLGHVNGIHGDSCEGKGWVALAAAAEEMTRGHVVMLLDAEDTADSIAARLRILGVPDERIAEQLSYHRPTAEVTDLARSHLLRIIEERAVTLVVIDSIGEFFGLDGVDENHDSEVGPWLRRVARPLADAGPAVLLIDHGTKAADNPLHPSGSKRKRAGIGGASYLVEATTPLVAGHGGRLKLVCAKDRHGTYRRGEHVANIVYRATTTGGMTATVYAAASGDDADPDAVKRTRARQAVVATMSRSRQPLTRNEIVERTTGASNAHIRAEVAVLIDEARLVQHGIRKPEQGGREVDLYVLSEEARDG